MASFVEIGDSSITYHTHVDGKQMKKEVLEAATTVSVHRENFHRGDRDVNLGIIEEKNLALRKFIIKQLINMQIVLNWKLFKALP